MLRFIIISFTVLLSTACSNLDFSSNLDKKNFDDYFKPSRVTVYEKSQLQNLDYKFIAAVDGSSCQQEEKDRPADIKEARTNARINAAEMKANGIVFQNCLTFERDASCISNIICYGRAINVKLSDEE
ncbi:Rcs stress response system protein RcsF [Psychromonas sp. MB-3u-54]|uniref:Rcs stress response system protein RcsF n=1 Tax=Psychromonas sp. MB-3u-54 TaxID=2058319 RepID=UPI001E3179A0|nr:Rcs stress response system protein RcsF [Psychromonas sp. MB-3u-54]